MKDVPSVHNDYSTLNINPGFGFSLIPEQVREAAIEEGFTFNLLVVGRRGLGSTTLINSLFSASLISRDRPDSISSTVSEIFENNIRLVISVTTYHGEDFSKIFKLLDSLNSDYFENEQGLHVPFEDKRIHAALYLVPGDKMSKNEIEDLKELSKKVNVIPIITKADMFTTEELQIQRQKINQVFKESGIDFYDYSEESLNDFPMATIASETTFEEDGAVILGRSYPWGFVDIENEQYSDFKKLQRILISECFEDLKCRTDAKYYNEYRNGVIGQNGKNEPGERFAKLLSQMESILDAKFKKKMSDLENGESNVAAEFSDKMVLKNNEATAA